MNQLPPDHTLAKTKPFEREREPTALLEWMKDTHTSAERLARLVGVSPRTIEYWLRGQTIPNLVGAFQVDRVTKGKVPPESWLATALGKAKWDGKTRYAR